MVGPARTADGGLNQMASEIRSPGNDAIFKHPAEERRLASGPNVAGAGQRRRTRRRATHGGGLPDGGHHVGSSLALKGIWPGKDVAAESGVVGQVEPAGGHRGA
jgi:hypothetical protein